MESYPTCLRISDLKGVRQKTSVLVYDPEFPEEFCYKIQQGWSVAQRDSGPIYLVNSGKEGLGKLALLACL